MGADQFPVADIAVEVVGDQIALVRAHDQHQMMLARGRGVTRLAPGFLGFRLQQRKIGS